MKTNTLFLIIFRSFLLRKKIIVEKIKTLMLYSINCFNRVAHEIMWKNTVEPGRSQMTILCMRIGRWIPKATNTDSECVIAIAFPQQQWLHKHTTTLR